ncbi:MAG: multicopper oxidase domain-containing protein [Isosphaeraceae bacterium]
MRSQTGRRARGKVRGTIRVEGLETRDLLAAANLFMPPANLYPSEALRTPPVIQSQNGSLDATLNMVKAGLDSDPILYGGEPIFSSPPDPNSGNNPNKPVYAMVYQVDAYGQSHAAQAPGPILQLQRGETLRLRVNDNLAEPGTPANVVFNTNLHTHGLHVSDLNNGDNVYREITPGQGMDVAIAVPDEQPPGINWYHVHRHMSTHEQVYGGLAGMLLVGDPLDPWPQYKDQITQRYLGITEVNIQNGRLTNYTAGKSGTKFYEGWQKRINGQVNPTITVRPGETQVWNLASIGPFGGVNVAITDDDLQNPWDATLLVQDGNGQNVQPYALSLAADATRMQDLVAATLVMPGNRLTMAVTAPTTPGTYYLIDGWGGQDKPAVVAGQQQFYVLATIQVEGEPVSTPPPVFNPVGTVDPLFYATPDVSRTFEFSILPGQTPAENLFLINGEVFGEGVMPQVQIGTVEEWTLTNPPNPNASANHPFHIHQGDFIVTKVNGVPVDPTVTPPPGSSSLAYISGRDVIDLPAGGSVTIRFKANDFAGKYVFHCHILKHEDQGMMSPVLQFGPVEGLRMAFGTEASRNPSAVILNGEGTNLGTVHPFPSSYRGGVATASALGSTQFYQTVAMGTAQHHAAVTVYDDGALNPRSRFQAFVGPRARGGVSVAVGAFGPNGEAEVAVGSRANGAAVVRLFDLDGRMIREVSGILPGRFPRGVNVAAGDVNGDNFDDLIVSAGKGREPIVTAIDGQEIANGVANPKTLFTFNAGGGGRSGARVAVGYVAPSTVPSYQANLITTPESGHQAGTISVWNTADLGLVGHVMDHSTTSPMNHGATVPSPMVSFRPFSRGGRAVQIASNYLGSPGVPVVTAWRSPHVVAFTSIDINNQATTQVRQTR